MDCGRPGKFMRTDGSSVAASGGVLARARTYEALTEVGFLGRRRRVYAELVALSGAHPGDQVVDVGCGTGYLTRLTASAVHPGGHVTGIDPSAAALKYARQRATAGCSFLPGVGEALPMPDRSVDVVVSVLALHHVPAALRSVAVQEMVRVLRPGGRVLLADFRPPRGVLAGRMVAAVTGPAMQTNPDQLLDVLVTNADLHIDCHGELWPWLGWVRASQPLPPAEPKPAHDTYKGPRA